MRSAIRQTVRQRVVLSVEFIAGDFTKSNSNTVFRISHSCEVVTDEEAKDVEVWWLEEDEDRFGIRRRRPIRGSLVLKPDYGGEEFDSKGLGRHGPSPFPAFLRISVRRRCHSPLQVR
jgi:hypothetical protein